jgi:hypothetical protein
VLSHGQLLATDRWAGTQWKYPASTALREDAREPLRNLAPDDAAYHQACDRLELLVSALLLTDFGPTPLSGRQPWRGLYWGRGAFENAIGELEWLQSEGSGAQAILLPLVDSEDDIVAAAERLTAFVSEHRGWG